VHDRIKLLCYREAFRSYRCEIDSAARTNHNPWPRYRAQRNAILVNYCFNRDQGGNLENNATAITIAIISAVVTIFCSALAAIVARDASKKANATQVQLEELRGVQRGRDAIRAIARERFDSLSKASTLVQHIRDDIRELGSNPPGDGYLKLLENIWLCCDGIADLYANNHTSLPDDERNLLHRLKRRTKEVLDTTQKAREHPEEIDSLVAFSDSLTMMQASIIADCQRWQDVIITGIEAPLKGKQ
jgi:hypothetical protein